jgi:hypothetical protein
VRIEYDENNKPVLRTEENGVKITISFCEEPKHSDLKKRIVDLLTSAYETRVIA